MKLSSILASSALFMLASSAPIPDKHQHPAPNVVVAPTIAPKFDNRGTIVPTRAVTPTLNNPPNTAPTFGRRQNISPTVENDPVDVPEVPATPEAPGYPDYRRQDAPAVPAVPVPEALAVPEFPLAPPDLTAPNRRQDAPAAAKNIPTADVDEIAHTNSRRQDDDAPPEGDDNVDM